MSVWRAAATSAWRATAGRPWKPAAKRIKWVVVATNIYQDVLRRTGLRRDQINQADMAARPLSSVPAYLAHIQTTFADYQRYGGLTDQSLVGQRVVEIGPGETVGVGLRFAALGAAHVTAVDKFVALQTSPFHQRLYTEIQRGLPEAERLRLAEAVRLDGTVQLNPERMTYVYGTGIEDVAARLPPQSVDVIVSNAVLQEVYDSDRLFAALDRVLAPGGRQVHVIDLGDYGMFSRHGFHPLEFLTVPEAIYRYMVEASGQPNRRHIDYYRNKMADLGYQSTIYRTWVLGDAGHLPEYRTELQPRRDYSDKHLALLSIRPRLPHRYRQLSDDDLLTRSILLVAQKPAA